MNRGRVLSLQIKDFFKKAKIPLELSIVSGKTSLSREMTLSPRPQAASPVAVWGKKDLAELEHLEPRRSVMGVEEKLSGRACVILSDGQTYPNAVRNIARNKGIVLFVSPLSKRTCQQRLKKTVSGLFGGGALVSGGLVQMYGLGVLILGDSGVGKSESTLELVSRGHLFVSDDVVLVKKDQDGHLFGSAPELSRNFMEIRGLGIINIEKIFGKRSTRLRSPIDLVIALKRWREGRSYDRLGLKFPERHEILGVRLPKVSIPVAPGRNIATLIEVACRVFLLKERGYHAAQEISRKLDRLLRTG
ncbi:MAG: HPr(Ser) kinase/phosphatase [Candidatus Aminicenantales bacterium]